MVPPGPQSQKSALKSQHGDRNKRKNTELHCQFKSRVFLNNTLDIIHLQLGRDFQGKDRYWDSPLAKVTVASFVSTA